MRFRSTPLRARHNEKILRLSDRIFLVDLKADPALSDVTHQTPERFYVHMQMNHEVFLARPIRPCGVRPGVAAHLRQRPAAVPVDDLEILLLVAEVVRVECILPGRSQVLGPINIETKDLN